MLLLNHVKVCLALESIVALGIRISLNNFGKEYSSLKQLSTLPIDTLKIDKSFVATIQGGEKKVVIIDTIIKLAHELGMNIVAEGIETQAQLNYLISKKCYTGQGFLLGKPMLKEQFFALAYESKKTSNP